MQARRFGRRCSGRVTVKVPSPQRRAARQRTPSQRPVGAAGRSDSDRDRGCLNRARVTEAATGPLEMAQTRPNQVHHLDYSLFHAGRGLDTSAEVV